MMKNNNL